MSTLIAWRIVTQVGVTSVEGPIHVTSETVTDKVIGDEIKEMFKHVKLDASADEVDVLAFVAVIEGKKEPYYEPLDPFKFWPIPPEILGREYRDIVRPPENMQEGR